MLSETLERVGALLSGHFLLSSGRHSDRFIQKFRILENPAELAPLAQAIAEHFLSAAPTVVVSAAVGGILLGHEVARALGTRSIFVEKERGEPHLRRGFSLGPSDRALVVEDVVTTGQSVREVLDIVHGRGASVVGIGAIVCRGAVALDAPLFALLDLPLDSYAAGECPQCASGVPLEDPGSRRV